MVYAGLPFTTDFGVLDRLEAGEDIDVDEFFAPLPPFFCQVARLGGLLAYGNSWLDGGVSPWYEVERETRPLNVVEKLIAQKHGNRVLPKSPIQIWYRCCSCWRASTCARLPFEECTSTQQECAWRSMKKLLEQLPYMNPIRLLLLRIILCSSMKQQFPIA